jgi:hypothetical protein
MAIKKVFVIHILLLASMMVSAQKGTIKGIVADAKSKETLIGATVMLEGTMIGAVTDFDGNYSIENVEPGTYSIRCSYISYENKLVENVTINTDRVIELNFELGESVVEITGVDVVARANRESETMLLIDQKKGASIKTSIGAQELSLQGVSEAASGATKIAGITRQEGSKTLNVRGLGDRYNRTTLNKLPLPSNNAETKNIALELFPTDVIEYIGVEKVPTAPISGDFGGANIDIASRQFTGKPFVKVGLKSGFNSSVPGVENFYLSDGPGVLGFYNARPLSSLTSYFNTSWNPQKQTVYPNLGFSASAGNSFQLAGSELNAFATLSYENEYTFSDYLERRVNGSDFVRKNLSGEKFSFQTQTTGMVNLNYKKGNSDLYLNSILLNSSDQNLRNVTGFIFDLAEEGALVRRSEYERTTVWVNQLLGSHELNDRTVLDWGTSFNQVFNVVPDRMHLTLDGADAQVKHFTNLDPSNSFRYFHELNEDELAANISLDRTFGEAVGDAGYRSKLTVGYSGKYKTRAFESTQFNHDIYRDRDFQDPDYYVDVDVMNVDAVLNASRLQNQDFYLTTFYGNSIRPSTYDGSQILNAGFAQMELNVNERLQALLGARIEHIYQKIEFVTTIDPDGGSQDFSELMFLPSLSLRYKLNQKSNLRFASGLTYSLPQFTEMALFFFEGITETTMGNPYLYPSKVYNSELKWEVFPNSGEVLSLAVFGKYITDPINMFVMASASNDFSYANTGDWAYLYGAELEMKKNLLKRNLETRSHLLNVSGNLSLMETNQELDNDKILRETGGLITANFDKKEEALQGAAPLIANANVNYKVGWRNGDHSLTSSLVYQYVSDRLYLIGFASLGNQVDQSRHSLDYVLKWTFNKMDVSLKARNILNQDVDRIQQNGSRDFLVRSYRDGVKFSIELSYNF